MKHHLRPSTRLLKRAMVHLDNGLKILHPKDATYADSPTLRKQNLPLRKEVLVPLLMRGKVELESTKFSALEASLFSTFNRFGNQTERNPPL